MTLKREMRNCKNSIGQSSARKDFQTRMRRKMLPDPGHWEGRCGTLIGGDVLKEIERAYTQYAKDVYRYLLSLSHDEDLAEELTQETFFRAMRTIDRYDGSCKLSVWLCQIAKHLWYQWVDRRARWKQVELTEEVPGQEAPEKATLLYMEKTELYQAIHALPEPMRELVHLRLTGEFTFAEIGRILGKSETWARTTFYRAKQKIMEEMEGSG